MSSSLLPNLGPAQVLFGPAGVEYDLGKTKEVDFKLTETVAEVTYDQTGESPYDEVISGRKVEADCNFGDLSYTLFNSVLSGQGGAWWSTQVTPSATASAEAFDIRTGIGTSKRNIAQSLVLRPYSGPNTPSTDSEDWITIPVCAPKLDASLRFDPKTQRVLKCTFVGYPVSVALPRIAFLGASAQLPLA